MLVDNGKYYLYRHIRLDKNEPFYIGIGTKNKLIKNPYFRSISKYDRNKIWQKITFKTKYEVEILLESNNYNFIKEKEIEFIKLYGRKDLNTGILCNMTDGGNGLINCLSIQGSNSYAAKKVLQYDKMGNFIAKYDCIAEASEKTNIKASIIYDCCNKDRLNTGAGYRWFHYYENYPLNIGILKASNKSSSKRRGEKIYQ